MKLLEIATQTKLAYFTKPIVHAFCEIVYEKAPEETVQQRIAICRQNKCGCYLKTIDNNEVCGLKNGGCGCFLDLKTGTANESCPKKYW